jgi:acetyl esterase
MNEEDEGVLDPWAAEWLRENAALVEPAAEYNKEYLDASRVDFSPFPTKPMAKTTDELIGGVPVRIYEHDHRPAGLLVYFHGGGFCGGSIALTEVIATELAHSGDVAEISVGYRLAPEDPFPAGLDDCTAVTRWALTNSARFGVPPTRVVVAGESAGGNLAAAVSLRLRDEPPAGLAGQLLIYPVLDEPSASYPSRVDCETMMLRRSGIERAWAMYTAGRDLSRDQLAFPMQAASLTGLPPALVIVGGCDVLRPRVR